MNPRVAKVVAWGSLVLSGLSVLGTLVLLLGFKASASVQIAPQEYIFGLSFLGFSIVGALVTPRRPENLLGWLFCAAGVFRRSLSQPPSTAFRRCMERSTTGPPATRASGYRPGSPFLGLAC